MTELNIANASPCSTTTEAGRGVPGVIDQEPQERVPREGGHVEAHRRRGALQHQGNGAIGEARSADASMAIDSAKNGARGNASDIEPGANGAHGADLRA